MKNKILYLLVYMFVLAGLTSCDDVTTEGFTDITYYATLEVLGEAEVFVDKGATYVDAGVVADLNGVDVTDLVEVVSNVDASVGGVYSVSYQVTNEDGFVATASRVVYVVDTTPTIIASGIHTTQDGTYRFWFSSEAVVNFSGFDILILQLEPGVFYISDFIGGYYDQKVGYGPAYAMGGTFQLNDDNTITPLSNSVPAWGDAMDEMTASAVDPETGAISYTLSYAGAMEFNIFMN